MQSLPGSYADLVANIAAAAQLEQEFDGQKTHRAPCTETTGASTMAFYACFLHSTKLQIS
jgi:hypothetical protein